MLDLDRHLAQFAARQHGLICLNDVIGAGGTKHHATTRVRTGRWEHVHETVYRLAGLPWTYEARVLALILAAGPGAVASFFCAARLLGLGFWTASPEISIPRGRRHYPNSRVHTSTDLDRCRIVVRNGIPMTEPARVLLDLARYLGPQSLQRAIEQGRRLELVTWSDLIRCLAEHARRGRPGVRKLRRAIAAGATTDEVTDTDSELMALSVIREAGLPEPTLHHRVYDDDGELIAEMDLAYEKLMLDIEINGTAHLDPAVIEKDDARDALLRRLGWTVRRVWWEIPVRRPEQFLRVVRAELAEAEKRFL